MWPSNPFEPGWFDISNNVRQTSSNIYEPKFTESNPPEPVTLDQIKSQCRVDFPDDDSLLTLLGKGARKSLERYCSISMVPKQVNLTLDLIAAVEIPYGPNIAITSFVDKDGNTIDTGTYEISGDQFQQIRPLGFQYYKARMQYTAGYANGDVPEDLLIAILNEVAFRYEHRGDEGDTRKAVNPGICESARVLADPYKRYTWF